jgi:hypothetical protein
MTIQADTMGEQPIFTCKAHVFHIDPKTKRWDKQYKKVFALLPSSLVSTGTSYTVICSALASSIP